MEEKVKTLFKTQCTLKIKKADMYESGSHFKGSVPECKIRTYSYKYY